LPRDFLAASEKGEDASSAGKVLSEDGEVKEREEVLDMKSSVGMGRFGWVGRCWWGEGEEGRCRGGGHQARRR
jgi:hypothetical protein